MYKRRRSHNFPSCGIAPDRMFSVGQCEVCDLPLVHMEVDGPPVAKTHCVFHNPIFQAPQRRKAQIKTRGHMLLERVTSRHKDARGAGSIKMTKQARQDLIDEIDKELE